jgi:hypothetical protein
LQAFQALQRDAEIHSASQQKDQSTRQRAVQHLGQPHAGHTQLALR